MASDAPRPLSQAEAKAWLESRGWRCERGGKHVVKMVKAGRRPITLPQHKRRDYSDGLRAAIIRQAERPQE